jgi:pimeloyl-ACP methyl ester carboxylesterase
MRTATALSLLIASVTTLSTVDRTFPSADGVPIHFHVEGEGSPPLVFVHGWSCDATYWDKQVGKFRKQHRVVTVDLAGHGQSGSGRTDWSIPAYAGDVRAVLEALDLRQAVLIGHSMSGYVIVETARLVPDRVVGLVPVDFLFDIESSPDPDELARFIDGMTRDFRGTAGAFIRGMFLEDADPDLVERIVADMTSAPPEVAVPTLRGVFGFDIAAAITQVRHPIHAINSMSHPTRVEINQRYAPRFEVTLMDGVGHFPMLEDPKRFNRILAQTIAGLGFPRPAGSPAEGGP